MKKKGLLTALIIALVLFPLLNSCQSSGRAMMDPQKPVDFKGMGFAYYQDGEHLRYDQVRLEFLRNPRSRPYQVKVNKWENQVFLQVLSGVFFPFLPLYVGQDTALRKESVRLYNESLDVGDSVIEVKNWQDAGFIGEPRR